MSGDIGVRLFLRSHSGSGLSLLEKFPGILSVRPRRFLFRKFWLFFSDVSLQFGFAVLEVQETRSYRSVFPWLSLSRERANCFNLAEYRIVKILIKESLDAVHTHDFSECHRQSSLGSDTVPAVDVRFLPTF